MTTEQRVDLAALREQVGQIIDATHDDIMERSVWDDDNPEKTLVGSWGITRDAADRILALPELQAWRAAYEREQARADRELPPDPENWCHACKHPWSKHGSSIGCTVRVDSAWTPTNDRACGCSAKPPEARADRGAVERDVADWVLQYNQALADGNDADAVYHDMVRAARAALRSEERAAPGGSELDELPWTHEGYYGERIMNAAGYLRADAVNEETARRIVRAVNEESRVVEAKSDDWRCPLCGMLNAAGIEWCSGPEAQGHVPTIRRMLAEGADWPAIGRAIGWEPNTARKHFEALTVEGSPKSLPKETHIRSALGPIVGDAFKRARRLAAESALPDVEPFVTAIIRTLESIGGRPVEGSSPPAVTLDLRDALKDLVDIIDAAGLLNLSNGVQLGATSWYVKAHDRLEYARATLTREADR